MGRWDTLLAWAAIGVAASIAGMIWPFRRGLVGVVVNVVVGAAGGVLVPLLSYAFLPPSRPHDSAARLYLAAVGALAALGLTHAVWLRRAERQRNARRRGGGPVVGVGARRPRPS